MNSILTSVKKIIGITRDYEHFDADLTLHINAAFATLNQLGVGPSEGYRITSADNVWTEFLSEGPMLDMVKDYVALKVRLLFDSPSSSTMHGALESAVKEFEWRLYCAAETK